MPLIDAELAKNENDLTRVLKHHTPDQTRGRGGMAPDDALNCFEP